MSRPNIVFLLADQLRAQSITPYGMPGIPMPNFDRLAAESVTFQHCISTYPLCTPYRAMLMTGRHPQTTGMFVNYTCTRHDEIGMADAFAQAGYATGYVGKWHLHRAAFPGKSRDWIPEGRSRLGWQYWRAYSCHTDYFDGHVNTHDWRCEPWKGYETEGLLPYAAEFLDEVRQPDQPFFLFVSPHQPHSTGGKPAPDRFYEGLPDNPWLPPCVPDTVPDPEGLRRNHRHYLAMTLAVDEMIGNVRRMLEERGLLENTIFIFTSDHGSGIGSHPDSPDGEGGVIWNKRRPYRESVEVPLFIRFPDAHGAGERRDALFSPVDFFPTLCRLCDLPTPRTVEGRDLSATVRGEPEVNPHDALFTMNLINYEYSPDWIKHDGNEWRGVRTQRWSYARWRDGRTELYDLQADPWELTNLADSNPEQRDAMEARLQAFLKHHHDEFLPSSEYRAWIDGERRIVHNAHGPLSFPESEPDWSLLQ